MDEAMRDCENEEVVLRQQQGAAFKYPLSETQSDNTNLQVPFNPVAGESVKIIGETSKNGTIALSNYRLFIHSSNGINYNIPIGMIESCEVKELYFLYVQCKEARTVRCTFSTAEACLEWFKRITRVAQTPTNLQDFFAFAFYAWTMEIGDAEVVSKLTGDLPLSCEQLFKKEVERLRFDTHGAWRITQANSNYRLCPSYPPLLLVPACVSDDTLEMVARFRSSRRIPVVVWRHVGNGAVIARCSQPEVGWLGWRSTEDEDLLKAMADACSFDRGAQSMLDVHLSLDSSPHSLNLDENALASSVGLNDGKKVLIMDARSYTTAVANRARGGGCECPEYYPSCEIEFMNLANIHSIRKSFQSIRLLCAYPPDAQNWFSTLESTRWLHHMSGLMKSATVLANAVERKGRPVLVHCSDGWDRTPQIVSLGQILLDPYYRTIEGFRVLCEREWLDFGHKFADRCGHAVGQEDLNERCPVFLQWLDCIHQLINQFPCSFEFSQTYLVKLAKHTYSHMFGTFLCNSRQDRESKDVYNNTFYVWPFLTDINFRNHLYTPPNENEGVLWPSFNVRDLRLWTEMYLGSLEVDTSIETGTSQNGTSSEFVNVRESTANGEGSGSMTKTRSYGDLKMAADTMFNQPRRSSDPSILTDSIKLETLSLCDMSEKDQSIIVQSPNPDENSESNTENHQTIEETSLTTEITTHKPSEISPSSTGQDPPPPNNGQDLSPPSNGQDQSPPSNGQDQSDTSDKIETNDKEVNTSDSNTEYLRLVDNNFELDNNKHETVIPSIVNGNSVDTSTETIIPENNSSAEPEINNVTTNGADSGAHSEPNDNVADVENVEIRNNVSGGTCKMCSQKRRYIADKFRKKHCKEHYKNGRHTSISPSHTCTTLLPTDSKLTNSSCDLDGLTPLQSSIQNRLWQIVSDYKAKQEALERELHTTRMALIQQVCHHCTNESSDTHDETCSMGGSVCSVGEGRMSANESLPSDVSWETLDAPCHIPDSVNSEPIRWVPDHAAPRCMGCHTEFWLGRRRHHCRCSTKTKK